MFFHNFKYSFKILFQNKMLIFWTFAFPIILGTLFYMAFSNIENNEKFNTIDIAIVNNKYFQENKIIKESYKLLSDNKNKDRIFNIKYVNQKKAKELLEDKKIMGYIIFNKNEQKLVVETQGINETILKYVTEEIVQKADIVNNIVKEEISKEISERNYKVDYEKIYEEAIQSTLHENIQLNDITNNNMSYTMIEFYTLIAMTCLYGGILAMTIINNTLPNMGHIGKRISISSLKKSQTIISSLLASYVVQLIGLFLLFIYTIFVLKVDYGTNLPLIIVLALCGSLAGLTLGISVGTLIKKNENTKTGILISITMLGCFLSGMMGITMKYIVDKNIPIINKINPASMITDGFYSLYYYKTLDRYLLNVISLLIFSIIMILISYRSLRRQKYDSI